jgi:16S rRNA (uracil1498-N3)-methyltransferase
MTTTPARPRPRFLAPDLDPASSQARLPPEESRHLTRVLRLTAGAIVGVFDGRGREFLARVTDARDAGVTLALLEPVEPAPESVVPFTLVQAMLKGHAMDDIVRDATMMGAAAIQPVMTQHAVVKAAPASRGASVQRWRRIAIASAKQSRRATIPDVLEPSALDSALSAGASALVLFFVEPSAGRAARSLGSFVGSAPPDRAALVVGPEGGWAAAEIDLAERRGAALVTLGHLTLRAEAVPMATMAVFRMLWEE